MFSFVTRLALTAVLATSALAQTYVINTPLNVAVCQPSLLTWQGGVAPYFLSILPAGQPTAPALVDLGQQTGTSVTWIANLGVGVSAFLNLRDSTGTLAQSGPFTIRTGGNITCVGQDAVTSAGPNSPAAATSAGSGSSSGGSSATKATGSSSASATPSNAAGVSYYAPVGFASILGAAVLAFTA